MKNLLSRTLIGMAVIALTGIMAFAEGKSEKVTIVRDVVVNGTVVKKGNYTLVFNDQRGEMVIMRGKKTMVKVPVHMEEQRSKASSMELRITKRENSSVLRGITLAGATNSIVVNDNEIVAAPQQ